MSMDMDRAVLDDIQDMMEEWKERCRLGLAYIDWGAILPFYTHMPLCHDGWDY